MSGASLRPTLRMAAAFGVVGVLMPLALATRAPALFGAERTAQRLAGRVLRLWAGVMLRIMGVRIETQGTAPAGCYLVVANHVSYLDVLVLGQLFPGRFIAKHEIAGWPLFGWMSRSVGTLFVVKGRRTNLLAVGAEMTATLRAGLHVVFFPEGASSRGARLQPFHTALFEGVVREQIPCLPVVLHYEPVGAPWGAAWTVCWWGGMELWRHVWRLVSLPGVVARVRWAEAPVSGSERKQLAQSLHRAMLERFEPLSQAPVPPDNPWPELVRPTSTLDALGR